MPLTTRVNGSGSDNTIDAQWFNDYLDLLTGVMADQNVTIQNTLALKAIGVAPSAAASGSLASGTTLGVGTYIYTYTFASQDGESLESPTFSITTTSGNQQVNLTGIATGPTGTTARKLYRTAVGGSQRKFLATISDNTTTTYTDSTADGSLGATPPTSPSFGGALILRDSTGAITFEIFNDGSFSGGGGGSLGNTTISGTLTVTGNTTLQSNLTVSGTLSSDSANITSNGSGKLTIQKLQVNSTSTFSAAVTVSAGGLTISGGGLSVTSGSSSLDNGKITTDGSGNMSFSHIQIKANGSINATPSGSSLNGATSGTATAYVLEDGTFKRVIIYLNNFQNNGGSTQTLSLGVTFGNTVYVRTGAMYQVELRSGATAQSISIITSLATSGGSTTSQTNIAAWSFGTVDGSSVDTIGFRSGGSAHTGIILLEGF